MKNRLLSRSLFSVFLGLLVANSYALPPLPSVDWPNPRLLDRPIENTTVAGINLHTMAIDGYSDISNSAILEYDESYPGLGNSAGNFDLKSIQFQVGVSVDLPHVVLPQFGTRYLKIGVRKYSLTEIFNVAPLAQCGGTSRKIGYTLPKHGRYAFIREWGNECNSHLSDVGSGIVYEMFDVFQDGNYRAISAEAPNGYIVNYYYDNEAYPYRATRLELTRLGNVIETMTIAYANGHIDTITSSLDPARNMKITYWLGNTLVQSILFGGDLTYYGAIDGRNYYYISLSGPPSKMVVYSAANIKGKELFRYILGNLTLPQGQRRVYKKSRFGPPSIDGNESFLDYTTVNYLANNQVSVVSPRTPNNPVTLTLDATRGVAIKSQDTLCPYPLEEISFYPAGGLSAGLLYQQKTRPGCGSLVTKTFLYTQAGDLKEVKTETGSQTLSAHLEQTVVTLPNGLKTKEISKITDPMGDYSRFNYDQANGRLMSVELDSGNIQESYSYTYYNPNDQKSIQRVDITRPNSRQDRIELDIYGRPSHFISNYNTVDAIGSNLSYYAATGRLYSATDTRGHTSYFTYKDDSLSPKTDDRVQQISMTAASESYATTFEYNGDFPTLTNSVTSTKTKGGQTSTITQTNVYIPNTFILSESKMSGPGVTGTPTLAKISYDPITFNPVKVCGFSQDGTDQSCLDYFYKDSTAGALRGYLDRIEASGGASGSGYTITQNYDAYGLFSGRTTSDATQTVQSNFEFDDLGRLERLTVNPNSAENELKEEFQYDLSGKLSNSKSYLGGVKFSDKALNYHNDEASKLLSTVTDTVSGLTTSIDYDDPAARITAMQVATAGGSLLSTVSIPSSSYDLNDRVKELELFVAGLGAFSQKSTYDRFGAAKSVTSSKGGTSTVDYDDFGRVTELQGVYKTVNYSYGVTTSGLEQITATTTSHSHDPALQFNWTAEARFDALGRLKESSQVESNINVTNLFDNRGRLDTSAISGAWSESTKFIYDNLNRILELKHDNESMGGVTFSGLGHVTSSSDARGNQTTYTYDALSRLRSTLYPDGRSENITSISYSAPNSNPNTVFQTVIGTNRAGDTVTKSYNVFGDAKSENVASAQFGPFSRSYTYNTNSLRLISNVATSGGIQRSLTYDYDTLGRANIETTELSPSSGPTFSIGKTYDEQGLLIQHIYPNGELIDYVRDIYGRIQEIYLDGQLITNYLYDGPTLTQETRPGGFSRSYSYQAAQTGYPLLGGYQDVNWQFFDSQISAVTYGYDDRFRLQTRVDTGMRETNESFTYSNHNMLATYSVSSPLLPTEWVVRGYDPKLDGIIDSTQNPDSFFKLPESFSYDLLGNPISDDWGRTLTWSHFGLVGMDDPVWGLSTSITHDAAGRNSQIVTEHIGGELETTIFGRDRGLVLWRYKEIIGEPN